MQAQAAELSGCAGKFRCFLERGVWEQFVSFHFTLKRTQHRIRSPCGNATGQSPLCVGPTEIDNLSGQG
jgi:hypothetical protein